MIKKTSEKNRKLEQFKLPQDLVDQLNAYAKASKMKKTEIVELALSLHLAQGVEDETKARYEAVKKLNSSSQAAKKAEVAKEDLGGAFLEKAVKKGGTVEA